MTLSKKSVLAAALVGAFGFAGIASVQAASSNCSSGHKNVRTYSKQTSQQALKISKIKRTTKKARAIKVTR